MRSSARVASSRKRRSELSARRRRWPHDDDDDDQDEDEDEDEDDDNGNGKRVLENGRPSVTRHHQERRCDRLSFVAAVKSAWVDREPGRVGRGGGDF